MIEVKALDTYEKLNLKDMELGIIPKKNKKFKVSKERLDVLLGNNRYKKVFVEVIEEPKKEVKTEVKKTAKKTTKKK